MKSKFAANTNIPVFADRNDPLARALNTEVKSTAVSTGSTILNKQLSTGVPVMSQDTFRNQLWESVRKLEKQSGQSAVVDLFANTQLGYLVYEHVGKQLATGQAKIHPTIVNRDGKNVVNQDVILQGIIAQLQAHALKPENNA